MLVNSVELRRAGMVRRGRKNCKSGRISDFYVTSEARAGCELRVCFLFKLVFQTPDLPLRCSPSVHRRYHCSITPSATPSCWCWC